MKPIHLLSFLSALLFIFSPQPTNAAGKKLNVLFIAADDLNRDLGCYGHTMVKSPNIDKLAKAGVRFERAYCQYALCNPSRTSLLSGRRPETTGIMDNETPPRTYLGKDVKFLPEYFREHGYFTARVGKIAHSSFENAISWDISESAKGHHDIDNCDDDFAALNKKGILGGAPVQFCAAQGKDEQQPDGNTARRIVQLLEQNKDKTFFIAAGFHKPHEPLVAPKKYFDLYDWRKVVLPKEPANDRDDIPKLSLLRNRPDQIVTEDRRKQTMAAYYAAVSFMDAQVGVVLDALDRLGLRENTVIVFFGDHGWHLGEHLGLWRKTTLFEEAAHAPLIICAPNAKGNGRVCGRTVEFLGIYPTLLELCGLPKNDELEGVSLAPLLKNPKADWKPAVTVLRWGENLGKSVRTERWRYSEWDGGKNGAELFDQQSDPFEYTNLARDEKFAKQVSEMKKLLAQESAGLKYIPPAGDSPRKKKKKKGNE